MEIKTDSPVVAKLIIALYLAEKGTPSLSNVDKEFIQLLRRFEQAYEMIDALIGGKPWTTDGMHKMISRIEQDIKAEKSG